MNLPNTWKESEGERDNFQPFRRYLRLMLSQIRLGRITIDLDITYYELTIKFCYRREDVEWL